jgi:hypothetical protein
VADDLSYLTEGPWQEFQEAEVPAWITDAALDLDTLAASGRNVGETFAELPGVMATANGEFAGAMQQFIDTLRPGLAAFDMFQVGIQTLASGIADAFLEEGVTMRQAIVELLKTLSRLAIVYALMFTAAGIAASTGWGAAIFGSPATNFKAAAAFAGVAIVTGVAAKALGRGGERGGAGAGGVSQGPPQRNQTINVNVSGSLLGSDPNELARSLKRLMTTAEADGAR